MYNPGGDRAARWRDRILQAAFIASLGCAVAEFGLGLWLCVSGVPDVRGVELNVVRTIQKTLLGQSLYTDPAALPFDAAQYSPLYYAICLGLVRLAGVAADDPARIMVIGRTFSFLVSLGICAGSVWFASRGLGVRRSVAVVAGAVAFVTTSPWLFLLRPDGLMCATVLTSLALAVASGTRHTRSSYWCLVLSVGLGCMAVWAKQTGVEALLIVFLYFVVIREFRKSAIVVALAATFGLGSLALLVRSYPQMLPNIIGGIDNGISLGAAFEKTYRVFFSNFAFLVALVLTGFVFLPPSRRDHRDAMFLVSLGVLFAIATVAGLKDGSAENYYDEFLIVAILAAARLVQAIDSSEPVAQGRPRLLMTVVAAYLVCSLPFWTASQVRRYWWLPINPVNHPRTSWIIPRTSLWSEDYRLAGAQLSAGFASRPDALVLSFDRALGAFLPDRSVVPQQELATILHDRGIVDYSLFRRFVNEGRIEYVIVDESDQLPANYLGAGIANHFTFEGRVAWMMIYKWHEHSMVTEAKSDNVHAGHQ
jgi:predicted membrane protein DUF2142